MQSLADILEAATGRRLLRLAPSGDGHRVTAVFEGMLVVEIERRQETLLVKSYILRPDIARKVWEALAPTQRSAQVF